jgi:hypothetical protein
MTVRFAPGPFMVAYCCAYAFCFATDTPMFRFYPLHGDLSWGWAVVRGIGPAMAWYGLLANALLAGLLAALVVPQAALDRVLRNSAWAAPAAALLLSVYLLRRFLF